MNQNTSLNVKYRGTPQRFVLGGSAQSSTYSPCPFINHFKETVLTSKPYNYLTTLHSFKLLDEVNERYYGKTTCNARLLEILRPIHTRERFQAR